jgi:LmbE family N-acetylglucosaminyl deacetylase
MEWPSLSVVPVIRGEYRDPKTRDLTPGLPRITEAGLQAITLESDTLARFLSYADTPIRFIAMWRAHLGSVRRILFLGAHADDIEIGAGGTVLELALQVPDLKIGWIVFSASGSRAEEARQSAAEFLSGVGKREIKIGSFRESYFPSEWLGIKNWFEEIKREFDPEIVFTHYRNDRHPDHRVLSDLAWNSFRNHLILEYEIPKYDGDLGQPNVFVPLSEELASRKVNLLLKHFRTQSTKYWFTRDTFEAIHRLRGIECASTTGRAEAFYCRKLVLDPKTAVRKHSSPGQGIRIRFW